MTGFDRSFPRHTEHMQRVCRDGALAAAFTTLPSEQPTLREYQRAMDLAVSNALIQFSAMMQIEINRIDADQQQKMDQAMMRMPGALFIPTKGDQ